MQTITTTDGHKIELYDTIDEMPIVRYHQFNKMMILGNGVGIGIEDIRSRIYAIGSLIKREKTSEASVELMNLNMQIALVGSDIDARSRALAVMVKSIDGEPCNDITNDGIKATADRLDAVLTKEERDTSIQGVKKKIDSEIEYYYPSRKSEDHNRINLIKKRLELLCDQIADGRDRGEEVKAVDDRLMDMVTYIDYSTYERDSDVAFEQGCLGMQETMHKDPKTMTVMEYYAAAGIMEERHKQLEKTKHK